jgi:hypothetical protein
MDEILSKYSILSSEHKKEVDELILEKLEGIIIDLLEKLNFKGTDESVEESIFEYGVVCREGSDDCILFRGGWFDTIVVSDEDILDYIKEIEEGFFSYVGISREEYTKVYLEPHNKIHNKATVIRDLITYGGTELDTATYNLTYLNIINILRSIIPC